MYYNSGSVNTGGANSAIPLGTELRQFDNVTLLV